MTSRPLLCIATTCVALACFGTPVLAQSTIKIGELNSYKAQPAFLEPYKRGWEMAVEEINAKGGVLGKKLEVISRDDGGNPGDAVRVANELVTREGTNIIAGTFLSNIGLAVTEFAGKEKVFFLAAEPLTDKITWQNGNKYTFRLRPSTYMQVAMLMPDAVAAKKKRWAIDLSQFRIRPIGRELVQADAHEGAEAMWSSSPSRRRRSESSTPAPWCRRSTMPSRTPSSTCYSAAILPSWCARAPPATPSRTVPW